MEPSRGRDTQRETKGVVMCRPVWFSALAVVAVLACGSAPDQEPIERELAAGSGR